MVIFILYKTCHFAVFQYFAAQFGDFFCGDIPQLPRSQFGVFELLYEGGFNFAVVFVGQKLAEHILYNGKNG